MGKPLKVLLGILSALVWHGEQQEELARSVGGCQSGTKSLRKKLALSITVRLEEFTSHQHTQCPEKSLGETR